LLPTPVVLVDYQTTTGSFPNQDCKVLIEDYFIKINNSFLADQSQWTYHRRFFLLDRISGVTTNNGMYMLTIFSH